MAMLTSNMAMAQIEGNEDDFDDEDEVIGSVERVNGEYSAGDYIEIDGIPSCVVFVDESGKYGIAMSFPFFTKAKFVGVNDYHRF